MIYFMIASYAAFAFVFALHVILSHRERRDLYDRITGGGADGYLRLSSSGEKSSRGMVSRHRTAVESFRKKGFDAGKVVDGK